MGAVFHDVVDHGIKVFKRPDVTAGGDKRHVLQFLIFLVLVWSS